MQEGWRLQDSCLEQGHLQEPAGKGDKRSLSTAAPKNKVSRDLLPWKSQLNARIGSVSPAWLILGHWPHPCIQ